jgi:uncharacterized membrane protein YphA (DoxX/SURF4 family)
MKTFATIIEWVLRIFIAFLLFQTSYYKLIAHPDAVHMFTVLGMEPGGRITIGLLEFIAPLLVVYPKTTGIGALLSAALMVGAIFTHLTKLGISLNGGTTLFTMAVMVLTASLALIVFERKKLSGYMVKRIDRR